MTVYATASELKAMPGITTTDDDTIIDSLLLAASSVIDGYCNRIEYGFKAQTVATFLEFPGSGRRHIVVPEFVELVSLSSRSALGDPWTAVNLSNVVVFSGSVQHPNYNKMPYRNIMNVSEFVQYPIGIVYGALVPTVRVEARWGYSDTVPEQVKTATITLASRWLKRGQGFWSDAMASSTLGGDVFYRKVIDPDVQLMLRGARLIRPLYG